MEGRLGRHSKRAPLLVVIYWNYFWPETEREREGKGGKFSVSGQLEAKLLVCSLCESFTKESFMLSISILGLPQFRFQF